MEEKELNQSQSVENGIADGPKVLAFLFYLISICTLAYAFVLGYQDPSYSTEIVGGDAYNYIIFTNRALIFATCGVASAIIGLGGQLAGIMSILNSQK
ncbi:hypothetical protein [Pseudidiomarina insulisalsae]|uniref:Uncharacterized protein n=1 Tax=Pseudidiomarina insulisalsae TaxID=575789 RepID=A0A432YLG3_9GAMM|nr:hypothetical protein [Pseudidiomarina insulisalsae]RUO61786.1 hypothetical protein CWI71_05340 [Pseudidiomarina insulisalsae]